MIARAQTPFIAPASRVAGTAPAFGGQLLGGVIFYALLALVILTAIPYGTVEEWWESLFQCVVFALTALWLIEGLIGGRWLVREHRLLVPLLLLLAFISFQAFPLGLAEVSGVSVWRTLSVDAYETRLVAFRFLTLILVAALLLRYTSTPRRLGALLYVVVGVGVASAVFGLVRQALHHDGAGFVLPHLQPQLGYGQFINNNHFALLMEMCLGLILGLLAQRKARQQGRQLFFSLAGGTLIWAALVLANSRGGIIALFGEMIFFIVLFRALRTSSGDKQRNAGGNASRPVASVLLRYASVASLLFAMSVGVFWVGGDPVVRRIESLPTEVSAEGAGNRIYPRRIEMWQATWRMIKERPFGGTGFGGYWLAIDRHYDASGIAVPQQAHNEYLEIVAGGGLVAVALVAWFVTAFVMRARKCLRARRSFRRGACLGALTGLGAVAIHSFVDFGLHITVNALVFTALIVLATARIPSGARGSNDEDARQLALSDSLRLPERRPRAPGYRATRIVTIIICLSLCSLAMWKTAHAGLARWYAMSHKREYALGAAERAVRLSPADPLARLARANLLSAESRNVEALEECERTAALRPQDNVVWINVGFARERVGDSKGALAAFQEAARLAPYYAQPRWQLGNALLRAGQPEQACVELSRAAASDQTLLEPVLELLWLVLHKDADALTQTISPQSAPARLVLARFLIAHGEVTPAVRVLRLGDGVAADERRRLVAALISEKRFLEAYEVWSDDRGRSNGGERNAKVAITDGSFEEQIRHGDAGFGWHVASQAQGLTVSLDTKKARAGSRSLRFDFKGAAHATTALVSQLIPTEAKMRYQVRFAAFTQGLTNDGAPVVWLVDATDEQMLTPPFSLPLNSNGWQDYTIDFVTKATTRSVTLMIRRRECAAAPCLLFGQMWLDDFSLQKV